ncbi:MAG: hypothetical protein AB8B71_10595 [Paracoccaceae bacterium]
MLDIDHSDLVRAIQAVQPKGRRRLIAVAGPPASGKSTYADSLVAALNGAGGAALGVPMDGFHLDNAILEARDLLHRKGAPQTFDQSGFAHLINRLQAEAEVIYPTFDRSRDIAIAGAKIVPEACKTLVIEGNYLLLDQPGWRDLHRAWDLSIWVGVDPQVMEARLIQRWVDNGLSPANAKARALQNDIPNAQIIIDGSIAATHMIRTSDGAPQTPKRG